MSDKYQKLYNTAIEGLSKKTGGKLHLTIVRGLPGSGKSYFANQIGKTLGHKVHTTDDFFVDKEGKYKFDPSKIGQAHEWNQKRTKEALGRGESVVVPNTSTMRWEIEPYLKMAGETKAGTSIFHTKYPGKNIHGVPDEALAKMTSRWEPYEGETILDPEKNESIKNIVVKRLMEYNFSGKSSQGISHYKKGAVSVYDTISKRIKNIDSTGYELVKRRNDIRKKQKEHPMYRDASLPDSEVDKIMVKHDQEVAPLDTEIEKLDKRLKIINTVRRDIDKKYDTMFTGEKLSEYLNTIIKNFLMENYLSEDKEDLHKHDELLNKLGSNLGQDVYLVGGPVRDTLMGKQAKDIDVATVGGLQKIHDKGWSSIKKDFPVFQHKEFPGVELALARGEKKTGTGHTGFDWHESPDIEGDLGRRDFTINAMAYHPKKGVIDPHGGQQDIEKKILRPTTDAFSEDPLRVLRGARFRATKLPDFEIAPETMHRFHKANAELHTLSKDRVRDEVKRALAGQSPEKFFQTLKQTKSLSHWFPEIEKTIDVPAGDPKHHPEGDTFSHTMHSLKYGAEHGHSPEARELTLVHDLGKAETPKELWPKHHGHDERTGPAVNLAQRLGLGQGVEKKWATHIKQHMKPYLAHQLRPGSWVDYRNAVKNFAEPHLQSAEADYHGRGIERPPFKKLDMVRKAFNAIKGVKIEPGTHPQKIKQVQGVAAKQASQSVDSVDEDLDTNSGLSNASGMSTTGAGVEMQAAPPNKVKGGVKKLKPVTYSSRTGNGG